ncbi:MAG: response regulator transcription factor [Gemmatimonadales bacterium]
MRVLLVEDQASLRGLLRHELRRRNYVVSEASSHAEAAEKIGDGPLEMLLIERKLPDGSGLNLIASYRALGGHAGAIVMTGRSEPSDRVEALDHGADDVIVKPFDFDELFSRIRALARRPREWKSEVYQFSGLAVDCEQQSAFVGTKRLELTPKEFLLLRAIAQRPGQLVRREDLIRQVWGDKADRGSRSLNVHIRNLRIKLMNEAATVVIASRRGRGYGIFAISPAN